MWQVIFGSSPASTCAASIQGSGLAGSHRRIGWMTSLFTTRGQLKLCMHAGEPGCFPDIEPIVGCLMPFESKSAEQGETDTGFRGVT
jgi:hypothetical protein